MFKILFTIILQQISGKDEHLLSKDFVDSFKLGNDQYQFEPMDIQTVNQVDKLGDD